jgi:hypothetical protein
MNTMQKRLVALVLTAAVFAAACSDSDPEVAAEGSPTTAAPTTAAVVATTAAAPPPSSEAPATAAAPIPTTAPTTVPRSSTDVLADGQPATWFGVRDDLDQGLALVEERDTTDGTVLRELSRQEIGACIEEDDDGECIIFGEGWAPVSIDVSLDRIALGMCCEPVMGTSQVLRRIDGELISSPFGSEAVFAPQPPNLITVGYADGGFYFVVNSNSGAGTELPVVADWGDRASWSLDGTMIAVEVGTGIAVVFWDTELNEAVDISATLEPPADTVWSKPAFQASGNLIVVEDKGAGGDSKGVVLNKEVFGGLAGDLVLAEFPYEGTVVHQVYDGSGTFLIYALDDGSVRWQGKGERGTLADPGSGHIAAAW